LALVHYQFEAIHPFADGNGRIGRLLISLLLCHEKLLPQPLLYLSAFFERQRQRYYSLLLKVSQEGAWKSWIHFFLEGVAEQAADAVWRAGKLLELSVQFRERLARARASALLLRMADDLFQYPAMTIGGTASNLNISWRAASLIIAKLVNARIVEEVTGRGRNRIFVSGPILNLIDMERDRPPEGRQDPTQDGQPETISLLGQLDLPT
jgi:Fic family protein